MTKKRKTIKVLKKREALALIEVEILLRRGSAEKIETDSRKQLLIKRNMKVYVIGIGLIGGSMVLDIKDQHPDSTIFGIDSNEKHLQEAIDLGVIDEAGSFEDLAEADFVSTLR